MSKHGIARQSSTDEPFYGDTAYPPTTKPGSTFTQEELTRALKPLVNQMTEHNAKMDARAEALEELLEELVKQRSIENVISDVEKVIAPYIEEIERLTHENRVLRRKLTRRWWKRNSK